MFGMDIFFKTAANTMKMAQKGVENMFRVIHYCAGLSVQSMEKKQESSQKPGDQEESSKEKPTPDSQEIKKSEPRAIQVTPENIAQAPPVQKDPTPTVPPEKLSNSSQSKPIKETITKTDKKTVTPPSQQPATAIDQVNALIARHKKGITTENIMKATGFPRKKVQNILYKLKKRREIQTSEKGLYVKGSL